MEIWIGTPQVRWHLLSVRQQPAAAASAVGPGAAAASRHAQCGGPGGRDRADGGVLVPRCPKTGRRFYNMGVVNVVMNPTLTH